MEEKKKFPQGWAFKKQFVDEATGDVYNKGEKVGNINEGYVLAAEPPKPPKAEPPEPIVPTPSAQIPPKAEPTDNDRVKDLERRLEEMREMMMQMQRVPSQVNVRPEVKPFGDYDDSNVPSDDFLERPIPYIIFGRGYSMSSYYKNGKIVFAPHNIPIYFSREFDEVTYHDGNAKILPFSRYTCHSKADSKFIENSDLYGILIFREYERAKNIDAERVDKYESAIYAVQRMDDQKVMASCVAKGIDIRQPKETLKHQLIRALIKDYIDAEEGLIGSRQEDMKKEVMSPPTV